MKKVSAALGFISLMALSGAALADGKGQCDHGGKGHGAMFGADADKDGKLTLAEAQAAAKQRFDKHDVNKDGVIAADEVKGRGQRLLKRADSNNDGKVTRAEAEALVRDVFAKKDANKDGVLTRDEMRHGRKGEKRA